MPSKTKPKTQTKTPKKSQKQKSIKKEAKEQFDLFVQEVSGPKGLKVVKSIGEGTTEDFIEKGTKFKLSEIRNVLNILHNHGIVEYNREKNLNTGWFTYTWRVNMNRAMQNLLAQKKKECELIKNQLDGAGDSAVIYKCPKGCAVMFFDQAEKSDFNCPSCTTKLKYSNGTKQKKEMETKLNVIEKILSNQVDFLSNENKPAN